MTLYLAAAIVVILPMYVSYRAIRDIVTNRDELLAFFPTMQAWQRVVFPLSSAVSLVAAWSLASGWLADDRFLPGPLAAAQALWDLLRSGELAINSLVTVARVAAGFGLAAIVGVTVGGLAGVFPRLGLLTLPVNSAIRYVPPTSFIGLTIIWFGIGEGNKVALIALAIIFYVVQMAADAVRVVPRALIEVAQTLGANRWEVVWRLILPMSLPELLAVLRINLGAAWTYVVVAELVTGQQGLGHLMALSQRFLMTPRLFALIFVVGLLGFASDTAFARLIRIAARWR